MTEAVVSEGTTEATTGETQTQANAPEVQTSLVSEPIEASNAPTELVTPEPKKTADEWRAEAENFQKQATDMRRILSKGKDAPETVEAYFEGFKSSHEGFNGLIESGDENAKGLLDTLGKVYKDLGITKGQSETLTNMMANVVSEMGLIQDPAKAEALKAEQEKAEQETKAKFVQEQYEILGDNAQDQIDSAVKTIMNAGFIDKASKEMLVNNGINTLGAPLIKMINQFAQRTTSNDIPNSIADTLPSNAILEAEYNKSDTSAKRRMEIIQQVKSAGREPFWKS